MIANLLFYFWTTAVKVGELVVDHRRSGPYNLGVQRITNVIFTMFY